VCQCIYLFTLLFTLLPRHVHSVFSATSRTCASPFLGHKTIFNFSTRLSYRDFHTVILIPPTFRAHQSTSLSGHQPTISTTPSDATHPVITLTPRARRHLPRTAIVADPTPREQHIAAIALCLGAVGNLLRRRIPGQTPRGRLHSISVATSRIHTYIHTYIHSAVSHRHCHLYKHTKSRQ
jgi:hypothetical protein